jgi:hypothetical protein
MTASRAHGRCRYEQVFSKKAKISSLSQTPQPREVPHSSSAIPDTHRMHTLDRMRYGSFWNLTWWDHWTLFQRATFLVQAAIALLFVPTGLVLAISNTSMWWFGTLMTVFSIGWLSYQYLCWRQLLADRSTALRPPTP